MYIYVLDKHGQPLMPTSRCGKVRRLLKQHKAKVTQRCPFTIQLLYETTNHTQDVTLGIDPGSKTIGISATTKTKVLYESNVILRNDIVKLIATRRELRHTRRNRKTRYRPPRFSNRRKSKQQGWLPPSVRQKIQSHLQVIQKVHQILPVNKIILEIANFDIQKIKDPTITSTGYQQGEQYGFENVKAYVLYRDNYTCQCCKNRRKDPKLRTHHIESRKTGGDAPNNLITLCNTCHNMYHNGLIALPKNIKRGMKFRDATFMNIINSRLYDELAAVYPNVDKTYGYITKLLRKQHNLPKDHYIDAKVISGNALAKNNHVLYVMKKIRCHDRKLHKTKPKRKNIRDNWQLPYQAHGFRLYDKVLYQNQEGFITGRRKTGAFAIRTIYNTLIKEPMYKKLRFLETRKSFITQMFLLNVNNEVPTSE